MPRLIPLILNPAPPPGRRSQYFPGAEEPNPVVLLPLQPVGTPPPEHHPRPEPLAEPSNMPWTPREWRRVVDEVRLLYLKRQYRQCTARCIRILNGMEHPYQVHPLYSIYLLFYAGTCLELTARSLHANSNEKMLLLQSSLDYDTKAESWMEYATFVADSSISRASRQRTLALRSVSDASSVRSSVDSIFSVTSSASSSAIPSPTVLEFPSEIKGKAELSSLILSQPSLSQSPSSSPSPSPQPKRSSLQNSDEEQGSDPLKTKKQVSFSLPSNVHPQTLLHNVKESPEDDDLSPTINAFPAPPSASPQASPSHPRNSISSYLLSCSMNHYLTDLNSMATQLDYHKSVVSSLIHKMHAHRRTRLSNTPEILDDIARVVPSLSDLEDGSEVINKRLDLQARIQSLRERGWRRERFSGEKYETLCERALSELELYN